MLQGFHVRACAVAAIDPMVMKFIGDHLITNTSNSYEFQRDRMETSKVIAVTRFLHLRMRRRYRELEFDEIHRGPSTFIYFFFLIYLCVVYR